MKKVITNAFIILTAVCMMFMFNSCEDVEGEVVNSDISLNWQTSGDDALVGIADLQVMKWSTSLDSLNNDWGVLTTVVSGIGAPGNPLSPDSVLFNMDIETGIKYYFAIKTADEIQPKTVDSLGTASLNDYHWEIVGADTLAKSFTHAGGSVSEGRNWSLLSNPIQIFLVDKETPLRITTLSGRIL